jgi:RNA polymerase sigma-70 factor, ECF subfamily
MMNAKAHDPWLPTRRSLISRLRNHEDEKSWREFFDLYWKPIYSFALRCGCSPSEAEEVVQETIIAFSRKMPDYRYKPGVCSFKGWLLHLANCRIIDHFRKKGRREHWTPAPDDPDVQLDEAPDNRPSDLEQLWEEEWQKNALNSALERLKLAVRPDHYQIFHLSFVKQKPVEQISRLLGINRAQVYLVKHRLANLLKREIKSMEERFL